ncbi:glycosyltransferase [Lactobacillus sp. 23-2]
MISIIILAHNPEEIIERCLLSVKNQTYQKIECLDNGTV